MTGSAGGMARFGLWLLPLYGVLLAVSTLSQQPPLDDFEAYAGYVTTPEFLISHLVASILGAAAGILGAIALTAFAVRGPRPRAALAGMSLTVVANVLLTAAFGSAAFVQPGIGRAYLAGVEGMEALNADTAYGTPLLTTAVIAVVLFASAAVLTGIAITGTGRGLRWPGMAYGALLPLFAIAGPVYPAAQPVAGFDFAITTVALARRLPDVAARQGLVTVADR